MGTSTLFEQLEGVLHGEDAKDAVFNNGSGAYPSNGAPNEAFTAETYEFAWDVRGWGAVFGVAYGLARLDDPCESAESVGKRALEAARIWYEDFAGPLRWPEEKAAEGVAS